MDVELGDYPWQILQTHPKQSIPGGSTASLTAAKLCHGTPVSLAMTAALLSVTSIAGAAMSRNAQDVADRKYPVIAATSKNALEQPV